LSEGFGWDAIILVQSGLFSLVVYYHPPTSTTGHSEQSLGMTIQWPAIIVVLYSGVFRSSTNYTRSWRINDTKKTKMGEGFGSCAD
jgi:hypothetical protein